MNSSRNSDRATNNGNNMVGSRRLPHGDPSAGPLHRIAWVLEREGVTPSTIAKRLGLSETQVRQRLDPGSDLTLSELYRWQEAMNVPIGELLADSSGPLENPVQNRGGMLKAMRTARSILEHSYGERVQILAIQLVQQLQRLMPESGEASDMPSEEQGETPSRLGAVVDHPLPFGLLDEQGPGACPSDDTVG